MQANINIEIAVLPFKSGENFASVCSDGVHHAAITNGLHQGFTSLWWAVESLHERGFSFDMETFKAFALSSFVTLCAPRGYYYKHIGVSWHLFKDGHLLTCQPSRFACIVAGVRHLLQNNI